MKNVQPPQILTDLYRDLRDRRLLLPALALVVALIAVPMALSSSAGPTGTVPNAPPEGSEPAADTAAEAAVLTRQLGVTAYRKRLDRLNSKNPFHQQFTLPEVTSNVDQSSVTEPLDTTGVTTSGGGSTSTSPTVGATSASSTSPEPARAASSSSEEPSDEAQEPTTVVIQHRIDVKVGPEGELVKKKGVDEFQMLPSSATPVVVFLGTSDTGGRAFFLVSSDVTAVSGEGSCMTTTPGCQLLALKPGKEASFEYAPETLTYKLKLLAIRDVVVRKTHG